MASHAVHAIIHVGMPKCGSSALQIALSNHLLSGSYSYTVIRENAEVLNGELVKRLAKTSATGYVPSVSARKIADWKSRQWQECRNAIAKIADLGDIPVFSNEAWGNQFSQFTQLDILRRLGLKADVVMYVRPQVQWLNSAWWQWGAWTGQSFDSWFKSSILKADWFNVYQEWLAVPGVDNVTVRLLPNDVVSDFNQLLEQPEASTSRANASLPAYLLRFFQQHEELRSGAHSSEIEFVMARHVDFPKASTPWVFSDQHISFCLSYYESSNLKLLNALNEKQKLEMRQCSAWWAADYYNDYCLESPYQTPLYINDVELIAKNAMHALVSLDRSHRNLQRRYDLLQQQSTTAGSPTTKSLLRSWLRRFTRTS